MLVLFVRIHRAATCMYLLCSWTFVICFGVETKHRIILASHGTGINGTNCSCVMCQTYVWYESYLKKFHAVIYFSLTAVCYLSFALVAPFIRILLCEERMDLCPENLNYFYADVYTLHNIWSIATKFVPISASSDSLQHSIILCLNIMKVRRAIRNKITVWCLASRCVKCINK
jgi:hypothetical protein